MPPNPNTSTRAEFTASYLAFSYAASTDPTLRNVTPQWKDAISRSVLISSLILDEKPGFLSQLVEQTYPGHNPGGQPEMSPEIIAAAEEVSSAAKDA
ncbi:hypothetical protein Q7P35_003317 [Cladosporium inversicolor]